VGTTNHASAWAVSKAWRSLPRRTRHDLVLAVVRGQRPRTDHETWRTALDWAERYPALAVPQVLMAACFSYQAARGIYDPFGWLVGAFACYLLVAAAWTTFATARIRSSPGPLAAERPSDPRVDNVTS
jgi:hypothetical protein